MIMFTPLVSTILIVSLMTLINTRTLNFTNYRLSKYNTQHNWQYINSIIQQNGQNVSKLLINENSLCEQALSKILDHKKLKYSLRKVQITSTMMNQALLKILFQSQIFPQLTSLILNTASIQDSDLALFPYQKQLKLQQLAIQNSFIGEKGLENLYKINMKNIRILHLYGISLVKDIAVQNLLKLDLRKLEGIGLGYTAISGENVIRILKSVKVQQLQSLNLTKNNFSPIFYKNLSQLNFSSLKTLDLDNLIIDETAVTYLNNLKLPSLTTLSIGSNQIFINGLYTFLNHKNYPKLNKLIINSVIFQQEFFKYLTQQFQHTLFETLQFSGDGIPSQIFFYLQKLQTKSLKILTVRNGYVKPELMRDYFVNNQFTELEELDISDVQNGKNVLQMFMEEGVKKKGKWQKLRVLKIGRIGKFQYQKLKTIVNQSVFPVMENLGIDARSLNYTQVLNLIYVISKSMGKLAKLDIIVNKAQKILHELASPIPKNFPNQLYLVLMTIQWSQQNKQLSITARLMLNPNKKPTVYAFMLEGLLQTQYTNMLIDLDAKQQKQGFTKKVNWRARNYIKNNKEYYFKGFQYQIEHLSQGTDCYMLEYYVNKAKNQSKQCVLSSIIRLQILNITDECYQYFNKCQFPNLNMLQATFFDNFTTNATNFILFPNLMPQLIYVVFTKQDEIPNTIILQFFTRQNLTQLNTLVFQSSDLNSNDFTKILSINPYMRRIRALLTIQTAVQDLSFYNKFNMKLRKMVLNAELIGQHLIQLKNVSFQWVRAIRMIYAGISNQQFIDFLEKLSEGGKPIFPQMEQCYFPVNYIESTGTKKLLQMGTPMLNQINFAVNRDPNIVNTVLGSPNSHRIRKLSFYQNNQDSIDPDLNPKNTREIIDMMVSSQKLQKSDFKALSHMDFRRLHYLLILFTKYFQCETFNYLVKISQNVKVLVLDFASAIQNQLNSDCLTSSPTSDQNLKHLSVIHINANQFLHSNLQKFFNLLIFDQILQKIILQGVYPSEKAFRRLVVQADLQYMNTISLNFNDLSDSMVTQLLNRDFSQLFILDLGNNPRLTSKCIQKMRNRTYYTLQSLSFARTSISDEAVQILATLNLPSLQRLSLQSTDITPKSLQLLSNLNAPVLNAIDLSLNNFNVEDLMKFTPDNFIHLQRIKLMPFMKVKDKEKLQEFYNKNRNKYDQKSQGEDKGEALIQIQADILNYDEEQQRGVENSQGNSQIGDP